MFKSEEFLNTGRAQQICPTHSLQREPEAPGGHDSTTTMALWIV